MLHFTTYDGEGNKKHVAAKSTEHIQVNIGGGNIQDRPVVNLDVKFANTLYKKIPFSVTDRSDNALPVLICKSFVEQQLDALIDVGKTNISTEQIQATLNEGRHSDSTLGKIASGTKKTVDDAITGLGKGAKYVGKTTKKALDNTAKGVANAAGTVSNAAGGVVKTGGNIISKIGKAMNVNKLAGQIANTAKDLRTGNYQGPGILGTAGAVVDLAGRGVGKVGQGVGQAGKLAGNVVKGATGLVSGSIELLGDTINGLFSQKWIKNLGWTAGITSLFVAQPWLLAPLGIYYGARAFRNYRKDNKTQKKYTPEQRKQLANNAQKIKDKSNQVTVCTTRLLRTVEEASTLP